MEPHKPGNRVRSGTRRRVGWVALVLVAAIVSVGQQGCPLVTGFESIERGPPPYEVTPVTDFRAVAGTDRVDLSWTNPYTGALAGVIIRRASTFVPATHLDGTLVYDGLASGVTDLGTASDTQYYYAAFAYDRGGTYADPAVASAFPSHLDEAFGDGGHVTRDRSAVTGGTGAQINDEGRGVAVDVSGRIVVAGSSGNGTDLDVVVWRFNDDGTLDTSFGGDYDGDSIADGKVIVGDAAGIGNDRARALTIDGSGRIVVVGSSFNGTDTDLAVWRFLADGTLDPSFDADGVVIHAGLGFGDDEGRAVVIDASGNVLVAGNSFNGTNQDMAVWEFMADGTFVDLFPHNGAAGGPGDDFGNALLIDTSGNIVVAGASSNGTDLEMAAWRLTSTPALALDTSFNSPTGAGVLTKDGLAGGAGDDVALSLVEQPGVRYVLAGYGSNGTDLDMVLWGVTTGGKNDPSFGQPGTGVRKFDNPETASGDDRAEALIIGPAGDLYVTGSSQQPTTGSQLVIWRYTPVGALDAGTGAFGGDRDGDGNADGYVLLDVDPSPLGGYADSGYDLLFDALDRLLVAGVESKSATDKDMILWRYWP